MKDARTEQALAECGARLQRGEIAEARAVLEGLEGRAANDAGLLQRIAEQYVIAGRHFDAARCHARAAMLKPDHPRHLYNLAASKIALGELDDAEDLLNRVIRLDPQDYDAWHNRSTLRTQTPEDNHVEQLKYVLGRLERDHPGRAPVSYALAKELEDLGRFDESWQYLQQGALARRRGMQYDVAADEEAMRLIAESFNERLLGGPQGRFDGARPIFVLGLPRSGTTLVDRILDAHSEVASLGEINTLAFSLMRLAGEASDKAELIRKSATIDFAEFGRLYAKGIAGYGSDAPRLVDKTPLNFLYIGLINLAMPGATVIHLRRHPLDSCYAIYKTLFRLGYPFSYSLQDVGRYYIAYHRLMSHWRAGLPGRILDVDYERLVADQEGETRRILEHCGLGFEPACLEFHRQAGAAATASAAQVRQPVYASSVGRWRCYERQLARLAEKLEEQGIAVG